MPLGPESYGTDRTGQAVRAGIRGRHWMTAARGRGGAWWRWGLLAWAGFLMLGSGPTGWAHEEDEAGPLGFELADPQQPEQRIAGQGEDVRVMVPTGWHAWRKADALVTQQGLGLTETPRVQVRWVPGAPPALAWAAQEAERLTQANPNGTLKITDVAHAIDAGGKAWAEFGWEGQLPLNGVPTLFHVEQYYLDCEHGLAEVVAAGPAGVWEHADRGALQALLGEVACVARTEGS